MSEVFRECEAMQSLLLDEPGAAKCERVAAHLARCDACREFAQWEERFALAVRESVPSRSVELASRVRSKLRRRRAWIGVGSALAASLLLAVSLIFFPMSRSTQTIAEVPTPGKSLANNDDADLLALFGPPPVDSLDVLNRQQRGYVTAMNRLVKE